MVEWGKGGFSPLLGCGEIERPSLSCKARRRSQAPHLEDTNLFLKLGNGNRIAALEGPGNGE